MDAQLERLLDESAGALADIAERSNPLEESILEYCAEKLTMTWRPPRGISILNEPTDPAVSWMPHQNVCTPSARLPRGRQRRVADEIGGALHRSSRAECGLRVSQRQVCSSPFMGQQARSARRSRARLANSPAPVGHRVIQVSGRACERRWVRPSCMVDSSNAGRKLR